MKTSLHDVCLEAGGKMVNFHGWTLPMSFKERGVIKEHHQVRSDVGMFDVSHMGQISVSGKQASHFLNYALPSNFSEMKIGDCKYSVLLNENGGVLDDLIVHKMADQHYFLCVNSATRESDYLWLKKLAEDNSYDMIVSQLSTDYSQLAVQGPKSIEKLREIFPENKRQIKSLAFMQFCTFDNSDSSEIILARTGYTGEKGYEIYSSHSAALQIWNKLREVGVLPCGLGARDSLRLEAGYLLCGSDANLLTNPYELGVGFCVALGKPKFMGQDALVKYKELGLKKRLVCFEMLDRSIARNSMRCLIDGQDRGEVTSGTYLPTLEKSGGFCLISNLKAKSFFDFEIEIRGKRKLARLVKRPLYFNSSIKS